jgi:hypothetical protein
VEALLDLQCGAQARPSRLELGFRNDALFLRAALNFLRRSRRRVISVPDERLLG